MQHTFTETTKDKKVINLNNYICSVIKASILDVSITKELDVNREDFFPSHILQ